MEGTLLRLNCYMPQTIIGVLHGYRITVLRFGKRTQHEQVRSGAVLKLVAATPAIFWGVFTVDFPRPALWSTISLHDDSGTDVGLRLWVTRQEPQYSTTDASALCR